EEDRRADLLADATERRFQVVARGAERCGPAAELREPAQEGRVDGRVDPEREDAHARETALDAAQDLRLVADLAVGHEHEDGEARDLRLDLLHAARGEDVRRALEEREALAERGVELGAARGAALAEPLERFADARALREHEA